MTRAATPRPSMRDVLRHYDERIHPDRSTGEMSAREWRDAYFALARIALKELEDCRAEAAPAGGLREALHASMCDVSHHDRFTVCKNQRKYELIADDVARRMALAASPSAAPLDVERLRAAIRAYRNSRPLTYAVGGVRNGPGRIIPSISEDMAEPLAAAYSEEGAG